MVILSLAMPKIKSGLLKTGFGWLQHHPSIYVDAFTIAEFGARRHCTYKLRYRYSHQLGPKPPSC